MSFGKSFLHYPDLFPARAAGEAWGPHSLTLDIAGPVCFKGLSQAQLSAVEKRYGRSDDSSKEAMQVRVMRMREEEFVLFDRTGWEYTLDIDYEADQVRIAGYNFVGLIVIEPELSAALWTFEDDSDEFPSVFENFYRILVAYQALARGGLLLHSAGILLEDRAHVCYGHSGAGKSTLAGLALKSNHKILSDDLNLIVDVDNPRVRRIPFAGEFGRAPIGTEIHPLGGLFRLQQGENRRERISLAVAFGSIIASAPFVNRDPYRYARMAGITERLLERFESAQLTFSKNGGCWDLFSQNEESK